MSERSDLLASITDTIKDYRSGELGARTPEHVERWVNQFPADKQLPILREINHVLQKTYISFEKVTNFLELLLHEENLVGDDFCAFWRGISFLNIQGGGNSQREMLDLFNELLMKECGFEIDYCGKESNVYMYLDDGLFTGNRIRRDLESWIQSDASEEADLHVVTIAQHSGGHYYANREIMKIARASGKTIRIKWWRLITLEDSKYLIDSSDVLRPVCIPDDPAVQQYVESLGFEPILRKPGQVGPLQIFSSEEGRNLLEQEFLKAGVRIREQCPLLGETQRPLGHSTLKTPGFGSMIATFRNCPNNAPLVLWAGDPWIPLLPRATNTQTEIKRLFQQLMGNED